ncbi:MAG: hypothetical protein FWE37_03930 [Spirochaetaceae bacterium]|nr:hypothetical protein [Spirochaetaceae bacterium]
MKKVCAVLLVTLLLGVSPVFASLIEGRSGMNLANDAGGGGSRPGGNPGGGNNGGNTNVASGI